MIFIEKIVTIDLESSLNLQSGLARKCAVFISGNKRPAQFLRELFSSPISLIQYRSIKILVNSLFDRSSFLFQINLNQKKFDVMELDDTSRPKF